MADGSDETPDGADRRLVAYGTLRPGQENHYLVEGIGSWEAVRVVGRLGEWHGYPAFTPDPDGDEVDADLLTSDQLPRRWDDLDRFEGPGYRRERMLVETSTGPVVAQCYVAAVDL